MAKGIDQHDRRDPTHPGYRPRKTPSKKNTRDFCGGKVGVEHVPVLTMQQYRTECHARPAWSFGLKIYDSKAQPWWCRHRMRCERCGKVLASSIPWRDCPDLPPNLRD